MIARRSAREMHWVLQVIGFCPECAKEYLSGFQDCYKITY